MCVFWLSSGSVLAAAGFVLALSGSSSGSVLASAGSVLVLACAGLSSGSVLASAGSVLVLVLVHALCWFSSGFSWFCSGSISGSCI